ncbi:MAG: hypothetical protein MUF64_01585 [Polyangiaceae bacterium]|nr:hypothetical protein [Polyangiaceae bacterium]
MNSQLRKMIVNAEGRYLTEPEAARIRDFALGLSARIEAARRLEAAEDLIVQTALAAFSAQHREHLQKTPDAAQKTARDFRLTLRYVAAAHVRRDPEFFQKNYASWTGELLRTLADPAVISSGNEHLRAALDATLDPADAREFLPYLDQFLAELRR